MNPIFTLTATTFVDCILRGILPTDVAPTGGDVLAMVYRDGPDAPWRGTIRFKYFAPGSGRMPSPNDRSTAYDITPDGFDPMSDAARVKLRSGLQALVARFGGTLTEVNGDAAATFALLQTMPGTHVRVMAKEPEGVQ